MCVWMGQYHWFWCTCKWENKYMHLYIYMWNLFSRIVPEKRPRGACVILFCNQPKWVTPKWHMPPTNGLMHLRCSRADQTSFENWEMQFFHAAGVDIDGHAFVGHRRYCLRCGSIPPRAGWCVAKLHPQHDPRPPSWDVKFSWGLHSTLGAMANDVSAMWFLAWCKLLKFCNSPFLQMLLHWSFFEDLNINFIVSSSKIDMRANKLSIEI
jgi:hypothetical protein